MLKSITLENYKCFKDSGEIQIAPLTVLCGVNSSGKSSILKSLLMLKQSYENESPYNEMTFNGKWVDNGYFNDIVYHNENLSIESLADESFIIKTTFFINNTSDEEGLNPVKRQDIPSFKELKKLFYPTYNIHSFKITTTIQVKNGNILNNNKFVPYIENNKIIFYKVDVDVFSKSEDKLNSDLCYVSLTKIGNTERDYYIDCSIPNYDKRNRKLIYIKLEQYKCKCYFSNMHLTNIFKENMSYNVRNIKSNLLSICQIAAIQYTGINFIAPLREHPVRRYIINGNISSVGISGENTPVLLAKEYYRNKIDVKPPYINKDNKVIFETRKATFGELIQSWMQYFELGNLSLTGDNGLVEININNHNIVDVGFGVSQALPIIVQGLYMAKDQSLLLEQPEIHLHPEMQLQMADFLIALAKNEKNVIVETHSDHFVNRIIHRVMQNYDELNDLIKIYIVEKEGDCSTVRLKEINKYKGTEKDKSKFFFTQYDSEMTDIVDTGLNNMLEM